MPQNKKYCHSRTIVIPAKAGIQCEIASAAGGFFLLMLGQSVTQILTDKYIKKNRTDRINQSALSAFYFGSTINQRFNTFILTDLIRSVCRNSIRCKKTIVSNNGKGIISCYCVKPIATCKVIIAGESIVRDGSKVRTTRGTC